MLQSFRRKLGEYAELTRWVLRDLFRSFWGLVLRLLTYRFIGLGCLMATLALISFYASRLESGEGIEFFGRTLDPRTSLGLLIGVGATVLSLLLAAASFSYLATERAIRLRAAYEQFCGRRILALSRDALHLPIPKEHHRNPAVYLHGLARRTSTYSGRIARYMADRIVPSMLVLLLAAPVLLYIRPGLTLLVMALLGLSMALHYRLSIRAAQESLQREAAMIGSSRAYRHHLRELGSRLEPAGDEELDEPFRSGPFEDHRRAEVLFHSVGGRSQLLSDLTLAIVLAVILIAFGATILREGAGWSALLLYLLLLRFCMVHVRTLMSGIAECNRFYHQLREYFRFVEAAEAGGPELDLPPARLRCGGRIRISESRSSAVFHPGQVVGLLRGGVLDRYALAWTLRRLIRKVPDRWPASQVQLVSSRTPLPPDLQAALTSGDQALKAVLREAMVAGGASERLLQLAGSASGNHRDETARLILLICHALRQRPRWLFLDARVLTALEADVREELIGLFREVLVFIVSRKVILFTDHLAEVPFDGFAVMLHDRVAGLGDASWFRRHAEEIESHFAENQGEPVATSDSEEDLE